MSVLLRKLDYEMSTCNVPFTINNSMTNPYMLKE